MESANKQSAIRLKDKLAKDKTLREEFAGLAIQSNAMFDADPEEIETAVKNAVKFADALIKELENDPTT